jgi:hypothetical protein
MCRPPCCQPSNEGAGIAAIAVLIGAAVAYARVGPAVARIWHLAVEALTIAMLTAAAALAAIVVTWATVRIVRTRRQARQQAILHPVRSGARHPIDQASDPDCLACGDTGTVLRALSRDRYQEQSCPECQPVHRAG